MIVLEDVFAEHYENEIEGTYDCPDRIVLNAYFSMGCSGGGFRLWWRQLHGSDANLNDNALIRMAGRFSRRLRTACEKRGIPVIDFRKGTRKHEKAESLMPSDPDFQGVFAVFVTRAPFPVWKVASGKQVYRRPDPSFVNFYSFHIRDPEWGHVTIRMCGHPPFSSSVIFNGHENLEIRALEGGLSFKKEGNCFTEVSDTGALMSLAETLRSSSAIGQMIQVAERWIYSSCLCYALDTQAQEETGFQYDYSFYQGEYSRNHLFKVGDTMERIFQSVIDRVRARLDVGRVKTIFGRKHRLKIPRTDKRRAASAPPRMEVSVERPEYDLIVMKIHFGPYTLKIYAKGERVLRTEVIVHNARKMGLGTSPERYEDIMNKLKEYLEHFLDVITYIHSSYVTSDALEDLPRPSVVGKTRVGGIDLAKPRVREVMRAILLLAHFPEGFSAKQLAETVRKLSGWPEELYDTRRASYDLRKFRAKGAADKVPGRNRYLPDLPGLSMVHGVYQLHEKVLRPLLDPSAQDTPELPHDPDPLDAQYARAKTEFKELLALLGLAA